MPGQLLEIGAGKGLAHLGDAPDSPLHTDGGLQHLTGGALMDLELASVLAAAKLAYPAGELDRMWKTVLLNQFHDISRRRLSLTRCSSSSK